MSNNEYLKEVLIMNELKLNHVIVGVNTVYSTFCLKDASGDTGDWED